MRDVGERKEDDGRGCFDKLRASVQSEIILLINKHHDKIISHLKAGRSKRTCTLTQRQMQAD